MNDPISVQLKTIVERAVRPVVAGQDRKRAMREELLAHVTEVFAEECAQGLDDAEALERARQRFGDPRSLTAELQRGVSRLGRVLGACQRANSAYWDPLDSWPRAAFKQGVMLLAMTVLIYVLILGVEASKGRLADPSLALAIALGTSLLTGAFVIAITLTLTPIGARLFDGDKRSWPAICVFVAASLAALPAMAFAVYWLMTGDVAASVEHLRFACYFAPLAPVVMYLAARQAYAEICYAREWASLDVDA
ncbi:MAG: permease prefix domain 1-containing protein [Pirellulales bacterium]